MGPVMDGLLGVLSFQAIVFMAIGLLAGVLVGALPGLTATMAMALLVPLTFNFDATTSLILLGALYVAASFGDAVPACLINIPGTPSAAATAIDGFELTRRGRAEHALVAASFSSLVGALGGGAALLLMAAPLARVALKFGPPELFWLGILGLTVVASMAGKSMLRGLAGATLGLALSTIGIAPVGGEVRYTFGIFDLQAGITLIVALIGLFGLSQTLLMVGSRESSVEVGGYSSSRRVFAEVVKGILTQPLLLLKSSVIGILIGVLPGTGGTIASMVSYNEAARAKSGKSGVRFGEGAIEGVVASEVANNAVAPAALIPALSLGIPGSNPAAIVLAALMLHGIRPGSELFARYPSMTYTFIWTMILAGPLGFALSRVMIPVLVRVVRTPQHVLVPALVLLCFVGAFSARNSLFDVWLMLAIGLVGYGLRRLGFSMAPIVLGLVLGPVIETNFVTTLAIARAQSYMSAFVWRPLSLLVILLIGVNIWRSLTSWRKSRGGEPVEPAVRGEHASIR